MVFHLLPQNINVYFCCSSAYHGEYLCSIFATGKNEATGLIIKKSLTIGVIYDAVWLILQQSWVEVGLSISSSYENISKTKNSYVWI